MTCPQALSGFEMSRSPDTSTAPSHLRPDPSAGDAPIERFVRRRQPRWERLSALLDRATGFGSPRRGHSVEELNELVQVYRQATTDLAIAQRDFPGDRVALFLNQLVGRGYAVIYREPPAAASRLRRFFARDLPSEYRAAWPYLVAAAALFFGPLVATMLVVVISPDTASLMLSPG